MDDEEELRRMILSFRVSELHLLLAFAGRSKLGRKSELQARCIDLLKLKSPPVTIKIRKLYQALQQQLQEGILPPSSELVSENVTSTTMQPHPNRGYAGYPTPAPPLTRGGIYSNAMYSHHQHQYAAPPKPVIPSPQYPIHPDVKFKRLPFYEEVGELIKPSSLVPQNSHKPQDNTFLFHLTPAQANSIGMSRDMHPGSRIEYTTQVQLRFCLLETTSEQEDCFPPGLVVKVNSKICPLPNPIPPNKAGVEPKRPPRPVNITPLVKISPVASNTIQVVWNNDYSRGYVMAVNVVNKKSSDDLLNKLKSKGVRAADYTRGMIKDKLKEDGEIATTSLRVSIACPLGKMRMTTPCRSSTCNHFQCFDASLYLQMNEKKPQWMCPVCNKPAVYDKLVIDGFFQDVLESPLLPSDCTEIQLYMDGSWSPLSSKKETSCVVEKLEIPVKTETLKVEPVVPDPVKKVESVKDDVQIVTLSDSDDEPLVPRTKRVALDSKEHSALQDSKTQLVPTQSPLEQQHSPSVITLDGDSPEASPMPTTSSSSYISRPLPSNFMDIHEADLNTGSAYHC